MVHSHRRGIGVSVFVAVLGVGLIVASFATDHWIDSSPEVSNSSAQVDTSGNNTDPANVKTGNISFGLFSGYSSFNYGLGDRNAILRISCDTSEGVCAYTDKDTPISFLVEQYLNKTGSHKSMEWYGLFSFPMYVSTLVMLCLAILSGFLAIGFGVFNVFGRPIETITGPFGLYIWNIWAFAFSAAAIGVYLGLYFSQLRVNILISTQQQQTFTSKDLTFPDYSFYFVVGAAGAFILNLLVLAISGQKCSCSYSRSGEKEVDNGMILY